MNRRELLRLLALSSMGLQLPYSIHGKNVNWLGQSDHNRKPFMKKKAHRLWYRQPAQVWKSALPVGNGRMGGLIKGTVQQEDILINEESLWAGKPAEAYPENFLEDLKEVQRLVLEGKLSEANDLGVKALTERPTSFRSYEPLAHLLIKMDHADKIRDYRRELDMHAGIVRVQYEVDGIQMVREVLISAVDDVIAVRLSSNHSDTISGKVRLVREADIQLSTDTSGNIHLVGQIIDPVSSKENNDPNPGGSGPGGAHMKFAGRLVARNKQGEIKTEKGGLRIRGADEVVLLFTASTDYNVEKLNFDRSIDPAKKVEGILENIKDKPWKAIVEDHVEEHRSYFDRVSIDLGKSSFEKLPMDERLQKVRQGASDPGLDANFFQYGRYLLIASSRKPGRLPANLQGIWNPWMWAPWEADYHLNINLQMNYWIANVGNLPETLDPLLGWFSNVTERGRQSAQKMYDAKGWVAFHATNPFGRITPSGSTKNSQFQNGVLDPLAGAWMALALWRHYAYTGDRVFLKEKGYPVLKGASDFIMDVLVEDDEGQLVILPSASPENSFIDPDTQRELRISKGATFHNAIVREIFNAVIQSSRELGIDDSYRQIVNQKLEKIPDYQIGKDGTIQEWINDYEEASPGHRHLSHMIGFHPFAQITAETTPKLFEAAGKTIQKRIEHGAGSGQVGWSNAWMTNFYARLKNGEKAYENLQTLLKTNCSDTLFESGQNFQIESRFGSAAGIVEMVVQSYYRDENGIYTIELLPALPSAWSNGKINGICVRGGFEIGIQWREGKLQRVGGLRHPEGNNCVLRYGEKEVELEVIPQESLELDHNLKVI